MATEERPWVSVVVASPRSEDLAIACVRSILPEARLTHAPVVVARAVGAAEISRRLGDAGVPIVPVDAGVAATLPEIRGAGLLAVQTQYAALVEDHCLAAPGWLSALCAAAPTADVVGGRMGNARRARATDWAAYFAEYGFFSGTANGRGAPLITAANVLYGPRARPAAAEWAAAGLWEDVIHTRLASAGCQLRVTPAAEMRQNLSYGARQFCRDRFAHGYDYARVRLREQPESRRWLRLLSTPLLPLVLGRRIAAHVAPTDRGAFVRALPVTLLFLSAWSVGELAGYLHGKAS